MTKACKHSTLTFTPSEYAETAGYERASSQKRIAATFPTGRIPKDSVVPTVHDSTYPAPLILPEDDLAHEPDYPAQSLCSWLRDKERNPVTPDRRTIYVAAPPKNCIPGKGAWAIPSGMHESEYSDTAPAIGDAMAYLEAFYSGLPVKSLKEPLRYMPWDQDKAKTRRRAKGGDAVGLATTDSVTLVRCRKPTDGLFSHQLNLNDLLDVAIDVLPDDAYALLLFVHEDLYEDEEDDFCCGRAYGGSRVAIISTARYNPWLDKAQRIDAAHSWPASHCTDYVRRLVADENGPTSKKRKVTGDTKGKGNSSTKDSPLGAALIKHSDVPSASRSTKHGVAKSTWLFRACRTASHELGHCFGLDHCVYYACMMQGTASIIEDARQPPYLCPVDMRKVLTCTDFSEGEWYRTMIEYVKNRTEGGAGGFDAFGAWLEGRLSEL